MAVADCDEVVAVLGEGEAFGWLGDFVGGGFEFGLDVPDVDVHVVQGADGDGECGCRVVEEADALDGEFVAAEFAELAFVFDVPDSKLGVVATLRKLFFQF